MTEDASLRADGRAGRERREREQDDLGDLALELADERVLAVPTEVRDHGRGRRDGVVEPVSEHGDRATADVGIVERACGLRVEVFPRDLTDRGEERRVRRGLSPLGRRPVAVLDGPLERPLEADLAQAGIPRRAGARRRDGFEERRRLLDAADPYEGVGQVLDGAGCRSRRTDGDPRGEPEQVLPRPLEPVLRVDDHLRRDGGAQQRDDGLDVARGGEQHAETSIDRHRVGAARERLAIPSTGRLAVARAFGDEPEQRLHLRARSRSPAEGRRDLAHAGLDLRTRFLAQEVGDATPRSRALRLETKRGERAEHGLVAPTAPRGDPREPGGRAWIGGIDRGRLVREAGRLGPVVRIERHARREEQRLATHERRPRRRRLPGLLDRRPRLRARVRDRAGGLEVSPRRGGGRKGPRHERESRVGIRRRVRAEHVGERARGQRLGREARRANAPAGRVEVDQQPGSLRRANVDSTRPLEDGARPRDVHPAQETLRAGDLGARRRPRRIGDRTPGAERRPASPGRTTCADGTAEQGEESDESHRPRVPGQAPRTCDRTEPVLFAFRLSCLRSWSIMFLSCKPTPWSRP